MKATTPPTWSWDNDENQIDYNKVILYVPNEGYYSYSAVGSNWRKFKIRVENQ